MPHLTATPPHLMISRRTAATLALAALGAVLAWGAPARTSGNAGAGHAPAEPAWVSTVEITGEVGGETRLRFELARPPDAAGARPLPITRADLAEVVTYEPPSDGSARAWSATARAGAVFTALDTLLDSTTGSITAMKTYLSDQVEGLNDRIEVVERRLETQQERLEAEYARLESFLAQWDAQRGAFEALFAALAGDTSD